MKLWDTDLFERTHVTLERGVDYQQEDTYSTFSLVDVQPSLLDELAVKAGYERCSFSTSEHVTEAGKIIYGRVRADEQHNA